MILIRAHVLLNFTLTFSKAEADVWLGRTVTITHQSPLDLMLTGI